MSNYEGDAEPIAGASSSTSTALGKRTRNDDPSSTTTSALDAADSSNLSRLSPEPDEDMNMTEGKHPVWLVKIPKFLLQAWSVIRTDDLRLGTVRVYDPDHTGHQRMELLLPDPPQPAIPAEPGKGRDARWEGIPRAYDLKLTADSAATLKRNIYAFREKVEHLDPLGAGAIKKGEESSEEDDQEAEEGGRRKKRGKTRRITALCGTITNEAALQPQIRSSSSSSSSSSADIKPALSGIGNAAPISDSYRELLRRRREEASKPKRTIKMLDSTDTGRHNMLVAGVGGGLSNSQKSRFNAAISSKPTKNSGGAGGGEKFARMPKNELLDMLFALFERWQYWSLKKLRAETQQPESYLREVLTGIADLHKRGPYVGNWSLKPEYSSARKEAEVKAQMEEQQARGASSSQSGGKGKQVMANDEEEEDFGENDESSNDDDDDDGQDFDHV
ncbi:hypothetical protein NDA11_000656 [Ustilago hordei]|uniref:Transcription initiation factor IIF subunit beta n=1 Tax=Ustilago hordei TaxID=120017 RepID=I2G0E7_USTHO|nr:uncharacterized protein UHO2_03561 [Ustilago hordei]KAJ1044237.1 hypothetical protein NDA10_006272 [Ustilago hordei]KAJ1578989.1 hypothetical protein NDA15_003498 [Ustilago hordei]KAJ1580645.1 hypothetical protein NDA12_003666 [Ustilago hordei]KAJ1581311.1 hypothetical protein NDA11_000656 [Ustilago hordei]CCF52640.1 related to TFG2-TFIIF subunit (transcription initiation factor), 54 kD [Ustilago hordei]